MPRSLSSPSNVAAAKASSSSPSSSSSGGIGAKLKSLVRSGAEAAFGDLSGVGFKHLLLQAVNLGLIITSALMIWKSLILFTGSESPVVVVLSGSMEPGFHRGDILFLSSARKGPPLGAGDIVVFNIGGREIPIVHRVVKVHDGGALALTRSSNSTTAAGSDLSSSPSSDSNDSKSGDIGSRLFGSWGRKSKKEEGGEGAGGGTEGGGSGGPFLLTKGDNNWGDDRALYNRGQRWLRGNEHVMGRVVGFLPHVGRVTIVMNDYPAVKYVLISVLALFVVTSKE